MPFTSFDRSAWDPMRSSIFPLHSRTSHWWLSPLSTMSCGLRRLVRKKCRGHASVAGRLCMVRKARRSSANTAAEPNSWNTTQETREHREVGNHGIDQSIRGRIGRYLRRSVARHPLSTMSCGLPFTTLMSRSAHENVWSMSLPNILIWV